MKNSETLRAPALLTDKHELSNFACGKPPLNQYLKKYALVNQENEISRTYVAARADRVVGYYTLTFGSVSHDEATPQIKAELPQYPIPIICSHA